MTLRFWPGAAARRSRPAGGHFLLLAQEKVTKEKSLTQHPISLWQRTGGHFSSNLVLSRNCIHKRSLFETTLPHVVRERHALRAQRTRIALPDHVSLGQTLAASATRSKLTAYLTGGQVNTLSQSSVGSDVSEAFFFGYFLLGQQKKVTAGGARPAGCLSRPETQPAPKAQEPTTQLAVGLGCDRDTPLSTVEQALQEALQQAGHAQEAIAILATIIAKADEPAFNALAEKHQLPLRFFSAEQLAKVEVPNPSATVHRYMGTPSVSEAAALLAAGTTAQDLLVEKHRLRGPDGKHATVSIARIPKEQKQP